MSSASRFSANPTKPSFKQAVGVFVLLMLFPALAWADPAPINNAVPPCDNAEHSGKPHCRTDSDSVTVPSPSRDDHKSVIVPPEIPAEGLPNRADKPGSDIVQPKIKPH